MLTEGGVLTKTTLDKTFQTKNPWTKPQTKKTLMN